MKKLISYVFSSLLAQILIRIEYAFCEHLLSTRLQEMGLCPF